MRRGASLPALARPVPPCPRPDRVEGNPTGSSLQDPEGRDGRPGADTISLVSLLALVLLFFWKIALTNLILVGLDLFTYFYPYREYAAETLGQGHLPLWNPYLFMGFPFLANLQSAVFYPFSLLFLWLPVPKAAAYFIVLHIFMAGAFTYLFARRALRLSPLAAFISSAIFAFGGFLGAHAEHLTLVSVFAWLPLLLLLHHLAYQGRNLGYTVLGAVAVSLQFFAGHTQASFINLTALGCYALYLALVEAKIVERRIVLPQMRKRIAKSLGLCLLMVFLGVGLAAVQLLPSLEFVSQSLRGRGLTYRQAVSFSLSPRFLLLSLLPGYEASPFSEYIAYLGVLPLLLAGLSFISPRRREVIFFAGLAGFGLFLALGVYNPLYFVLWRFVPGFALFRAPARWLGLYALAMAILAGSGVERLISESGPPAMRRLKIDLRAFAMGAGLLIVLSLLLFFQRPSIRMALFWTIPLVGGVVLLFWWRQRGVSVAWKGVLVALVIGELFLASRYLTYNRATAPEAYDSLRTTVGHILADKGIYRVLSVADTTFDPGDLGEIEGIYRGQLSEEAIYDYLVATKLKEVLTPNLPLRYHIATVDGYDPLPLARYVEWERLFLPEEELSLDGRLREALREIPSASLLALMNVKYVIQDKVHDVWVDGVYYDLGHEVVLKEGEEAEISAIPWFPTTSLGLVSHMFGGSEVEQGTPVAELTVTDEEGKAEAYYLRAGVDTAEGGYEEGVRQQMGRVVQRGGESEEYYALVRLREPVIPQRIEVRYLLPSGEFHLRGITLVDGRTGAHRSLVVSPEYRLVHSGDLKIYENLENLPRAFVVHRVQISEAALEAMQEEAFDPGQEVILSQGPVGHLEEGSVQDRVSIVSYQPERVVVQAHLGAPGYLVLTDAYYPGWRALVDGRPAKIERADYYFRAVYLEEGKHTIEFVYDPLSFKVGLAISLASLALMVIGLKRR